MRLAATSSELKVSGLATVIICSNPLGSATSCHRIHPVAAGDLVLEGGLTMNCRNWSASLPCGALELGGYFHLAVVTLLERGRPVLGFALGNQVIGGEVV